MTNACTQNTCTLQDATRPNCGCATTAKATQVGKAKYLAGFVGLCVACCAVPAGLIAFGIIGATAGSYLKLGLESALAVLVTSVLSIFLVRHLKAKQTGARDEDF